MRPPSNNAQALQGQINARHAVGDTSINAGLKWGLALLDPNSCPMVSELVTDGMVDARDGVVLQHWETVWADQRLAWVAWQLCGRAAGPDVALMETAYRAELAVIRTKTPVANMDAQLQQNCSMAKGKKVLIYGIAFEAPLLGQAQISQCATSQEYYFDADSEVEMRVAFEAISTNITQLKLTQQQTGWWLADMLVPRFAMPRKPKVAVIRLHAPAPCAAILPGGCPNHDGVRLFPNHAQSDFAHLMGVEELEAKGKSMAEQRSPGNAMPRLTSATLQDVKNHIPKMADSDTVVLVETEVKYEPLFNIGLQDPVLRQFIVTGPRTLPKICLDGAPCP